MNPIWRRRAALPQDHGSWFLLLSPLAIGAAAAGEWRFDSTLFLLVALAGFFLRQPLTLLVKIRSGCAAETLRSAARFWSLLYFVLALGGALLLLSRGHLFLLWFAPPALVIWGYHLALVRRRNERHQITLQVIATAVFALVAPALLGVARGGLDLEGFWLWLLCWLQSAASILYIYFRLEQRKCAPCVAETEAGSLHYLKRFGRRALLCSSFNLFFLLMLSVVGMVSRGLFIPYLLQWGETVLAFRSPAHKMKVTTIGMRQTMVSLLFTLLFIFFWN